MSHLLEIRNLTVTFDTAKGPLTAVSGIDLHVDGGEVLAIVGESGSGKSVAMLAVMGLLPDTATVRADLVRFDGTDLMALSPRAPWIEDQPACHLMDTREQAGVVVSANDEAAWFR